MAQQKILIPVVSLTLLLCLPLLVTGQVPGGGGGGGRGGQPNKFQKQMREKRKKSGNSNTSSTPQRGEQKEVNYSTEEIEQFASILQKTKPARKKVRKKVQKNMKKNNLMKPQYDQLDQAAQKYRDSAAVDSAELVKKLRGEGFGNTLIKRYMNAKHANEKLRKELNQEVDKVVRDSPMSKEKYKEMLKATRKNAAFRNKVSRFVN